MPENTDPGALSDEEYWAQFEQWKVDHPDSEPHPEIPAEFLKFSPVLEGS